MTCKETKYFFDDLARFYRLSVGMVVPDQGQKWLDQNSLNGNWLYEWSQSGLFPHLAPQKVAQVMKHTAHCTQCNHALQHWKARILFLKKQNKIIRYSVLQRVLLQKDADKVLFASPMVNIGGNNLPQGKIHEKQPVLKDISFVNFKTTTSSQLLERTSSNNAYLARQIRKFGKSMLDARTKIFGLNPFSKKFYYVRLSMPMAIILISGWVLLANMFTYNIQLSQKQFSFSDKIVNNDLSRVSKKAQAFLKQTVAIKTDGLWKRITDHKNVARSKKKSIRSRVFTKVLREQSELGFILSSFNASTQNSSSEWDYLVQLDDSYLLPNKKDKLQENLDNSSQDVSKVDKHTKPYLLHLEFFPKIASKSNTADVKQNHKNQENDQSENLTVNDKIFRLQWSLALQKKVMGRYYYLKKMVELFPNDVNGRIDLAIFSHLLGKKDERYKNLVAALSMKKDLEFIDQDQAMRLLWKRVEQKTTDLEHSLRLNPYNKDAIEELAILYSGLGFHTLADLYFRKWRSLS